MLNCPPLKLKTFSEPDVPKTSRCLTHSFNMRSKGGDDTTVAASTRISESQESSSVGVLSLLAFLARPKSRSSYSVPERRMRTHQTLTPFLVVAFLCHAVSGFSSLLTRNARNVAFPMLLLVVGTLQKRPLVTICPAAYDWQLHLTRLIATKNQNSSLQITLCLLRRWRRNPSTALMGTKEGVSTTSLLPLDWRVD